MVVYHKKLPHLVYSVECALRAAAFWGIIYQSVNQLYLVF